MFRNIGHVGHIGNIRTMVVVAMRRGRMLRNNQEYQDSQCACSYALGFRYIRHNKNIGHTRAIGRVSMQRGLVFRNLRVFLNTRNIRDIRHARYARDIGARAGGQAARPPVVRKSGCLGICGMLDYSERGGVAMRRGLNLGLPGILGMQGTLGKLWGGHVARPEVREYYSCSDSERSYYA